MGRISRTFYCVAAWVLDPFIDYETDSQASSPEPSETKNKRALVDERAANAHVQPLLDEHAHRRIKHWIHDSVAHRDDMLGPPGRLARQLVSSVYALMEHRLQQYGAHLGRRRADRARKQHWESMMRSYTRRRELDEQIAARTTVGWVEASENLAREEEALAKYEAEQQLQLLLLREMQGVHGPLKRPPTPRRRKHLKVQTLQQRQQRQQRSQPRVGDELTRPKMPWHWEIQRAAVLLAPGPFTRHGLVRNVHEIALCIGHSRNLVDDLVDGQHWHALALRIIRDLEEVDRVFPSRRASHNARMKLDIMEVRDMYFEECSVLPDGDLCVVPRG